jgi:hypothetical protein
MAGNLYLTNYELRVLIRSLQATEAKFRTLGVEDLYDKLLAKLMKTLTTRRAKRAEEEAYG